ncbi:bifunctional DNA primase/polymerase [Streptomyces sp. WMMB303]|uniref:bifunctional DNA primase/polymerase n=1 Tax=Streptomyces sp. WMMB303 TaxID=3034154 RepID=UPI0023ED3DBA|nr:bifunctional DNA primase/polymerase [Streptomyces sp. WMMB303]MDF4254429.1 bifunctional DNA primase/polymerase [Streptomyces sp. WMMB303]
MNPELLSAALETAERGWPVIPLRPGGKRPAGHREDRCPGTGRCTDGHVTPEQRATTDPELIRTAWGQRSYNVGIATGPAGLLVVDLDTLKPKDEKGAPDGATAFEALCERAGQPVPHTRRVRTPSGGEHLYFTAPPGERLKSSAGRLAKRIDTRAWGGYVVAPGSTTPGGTYQLTDPAPVAPLPLWLAEMLREQRPPAPVVLAPPRDATRVARVALERETARITAACEGVREHTLFTAARAMGRFVAWGDIPRHEVETAFQAGGESAGLTAAECRSTLRSALNWSIRNARPRESA